MGENALKRELTKTRHRLISLEEQLKHSRSIVDRRRIGSLIKKQYYLTVFLETYLNRKNV
ncbi:MAG: hypothetical protein HPY50_05330 [Firmicutes bacterium]|nr:hypothetical protein [Bacillota bacterium]